MPSVASMLSLAEGNVDDLHWGSSPTKASSPPDGSAPQAVPGRSAAAARSRPGALPSRAGCRIALRLPGERASSVRTLVPLRFDAVVEMLDVRCAEGRRAGPLDDFQEDGLPRVNGPGEDLVELAVVVLVHQDLQ